MIFHKRYLIPVWSSRVVSAVITFIITIPMLSNNPPCSETSSEATFSLHFRHQSPDLYAFFGDRGCFKTTKPWKKILITDKSSNFDSPRICCHFMLLFRNRMHHRMRNACMFVVCVFWDCFFPSREASSSSSLP